MNYFKLLLNIFLSLGLITQPAYGKATSMNVKELNAGKSIDSMAEQLKLVFTTDEDKQQIDQASVKLKKNSKKWLWRFEPQGDQVVLRVNGKVQATFKGDSEDPDSFYLNGQKITVSKGKSFLSYSNEVESLLKKSAFNLDKLFFDEAHAFLGWLLGGLAIFAGGYWVGKRSCHTGRCNHQTCRRTGEQGPEPYPETTPQPAAYTPTTSNTCQIEHRGLRFSSAQMLRSSQNYRSRCAESQANWARRNMAPTGACFTSAQDCIVWKMGDRPGRQGRRSVMDRTFNKNLSREEVTNICNAVHRYIVCKQGGTPTTTYDNPPPPSDVDVPGDWDLVPPGAVK